MASLTFYSTTSDYPPVIGRTTATIYVGLDLKDYNGVYESLDSVYDLTTNKKANFSVVDYIYGTRYNTYVLKVNFSNLASGSKVLLGVKCTYTIETEVDGYCFSYGNNYYESESRRTAAEDYIYYKNKGYEMDPTEEDYDVRVSVDGEYAYLYETSWIEEDDDSVEYEDYFYTRPALFYFKGSNTLASGNKYPVNNIQELLINIYNFDNVAMAWKRWQNQGSANTCNAFYEGNLSADMMNTAHNYLGTGKSYNPGDKISAEMFTTLENKLNN